MDVILESISMVSGIAVAQRIERGPRRTVYIDQAHRGGRQAALGWSNVDARASRKLVGGGSAPARS